MPNPFSNKIAFQFYLLEPSDKITISLQSISGSVVYSKEINKPQEGLHEGILQFDTLPNGMYILSVNDGQSISSKKLIKN